MKQEFLLVGFFVLGISQLMPVLADTTFFEGYFNDEFIMTNSVNEDLEQDGVNKGGNVSIKENTSIGSKEDLNEVVIGDDDKKFSERELDEKQKTYLFMVISLLIILIMFFVIRYIILKYKRSYKK